MELSDLVTFSTVARLGGITHAADELNTVQSNVTRRIRTLESELNVALFNRTLRGYRDDRFVGPVMTLVNGEVRWTFSHFNIARQKFAHGGRTILRRIDQRDGVA